MDAVTLAKSINWLDEQICEAERNYLECSASKQVALDRIRVAKISADRMRERRAEVQERIELIERRYGKLKQKMDYKQNLVEASENVREHSAAAQERFAKQIHVCEEDLQTARSRLVGWRNHMRNLAQEYGEKKQKVMELQQRQSGKSQKLSSLEAQASTSRHLKGQFETRTSVHESRCHKLHVQAEQMELKIKHANNRAGLARERIQAMASVHEAKEAELARLKQRSQEGKTQFEGARRRRKELWLGGLN